jgi:hypothetical protein
MDYFQDDGFTTRTLLALQTAQADRDAIDADMRVMFAALADEHGIVVA